MIRAVADTNVLVSAVISKGNEYDFLKKARLGKFKLILSHDILKEFKEVINRPKFGFSKEQTKNALKQIKLVSEIIKTKTNIDIIKEDPTDNKIVEAAIDGKVNYLVSGDNHLLKLKKYKDIKIINAGKFLKKIVRN